MAWAETAINGIVGGAQAIGTYLIQSRQAKSNKKWQEYNNKMVRIQDAVNQNNITTNQNMAVERQVRESYNLRVAEYQTEAKATVAAAAVGAEGNSVDMVLRDISQNEARAQSALKTDLNYQMIGWQGQREASARQMQMQIDNTQIPKPNIAASLLSWGGGVAVDWWKSNQPKT